MTVDVKFGTVISAIAGLTISGVNVKDVDETPDIAEMFLPVLFINPDNPITDIDPQFMSFGTQGSAKMDMGYTLNYLYLHAKVGSGMTLNSVLPGLISNMALIMETIFTNDYVSGAVELKLNGLPHVGVIEDATGKQFHGCAISLRVLEHVQ
jgi:hypothetical protein